VNRAETRYVAVGDADVAYQIVGDGPLDLLFCYGLGSHIEFNWQVPVIAEFLDRLASLFRLIIFDRRGTGASDGVPRNAVPTLEDWTEDIAAVLDATGSQRTAILATVDTGPMAILYAAMHPERVSALVLLNTAARFIEADDYPIGATPEALHAFVEMVAATWGTPEFLALANPSADSEFLHLTSQVLRASATPRTAAAQYNNVLRNDVREVLPLVQVPTLVLQVTEQPASPVELGRYLAEHVDGATFVELPGGDLSFTPANHVVVDEVAEFLTGERPVIEVERILATVLFTDIVGSTERAVSMGDRRWRVLLEPMTARFANNSGGFGGERSTRRATGSSHPSTARLAPFAVHKPSSRSLASSESSYEPGCIPVSARSGATTSAGSPSTSLLGWARWRLRERSLSRGPSRTSLLGRESSSPSAARTH
jgi:pimeloyl-ACP methyl ester carboxylesterase